MLIIKIVAHLQRLTFPIKTLVILFINQYFALDYPSTSTMVHLKKINRSLSSYFDVLFFVKLVLLTACLFYFNIFFVGITDPRGRIYSPFLASYLDYLSWLRASILHTSNFMVKAFGLNSYIVNTYTLRVAKGPSVSIGHPCLGYGIMSFWIAFIVAQDLGWKRKSLWSLIGVIAIWFINCLRIAILLIALNNKWQVNRYMDHHDTFNLVAYALIMGMIYIVYKKSKTPQPQLIQKKETS